MRELIERVLDEKIRFQLRQRGGDIQVLDFQDGILKCCFAGRCAGCPFAAVTAENLVLEQLRAVVPQVRGVEIVER